jgi:hypothetical protein
VHIIETRAKSIELLNGFDNHSSCARSIKLHFNSCYHRYTTINPCAGERHRSTVPWFYGAMQGRHSDFDVRQHW